MLFWGQLQLFRKTRTSTPLEIQSDPPILEDYYYHRKFIFPEKDEHQFGDQSVLKGQLPYYSFSSEVAGFIRALYEHEFIISFDWTSWKDEAERLQSDPDALGAADLVTLRKSFTTHVHADRFVEGHLAGVFRSGHIIALLHRLKQIRDEMVGSD